MLVQKERLERAIRSFSDSCVCLYKQSGLMNRLEQRFGGSGPQPKTAHISALEAIHNDSRVSGDECDLSEGGVTAAQNCTQLCSGGDSQ